MAAYEMIGLTNLRWAGRGPPPPRLKFEGSGAFGEIATSTTLIDLSMLQILSRKDPFLFYYPARLESIHPISQKLFYRSFVYVLM
jgi:hypothetical protein